MELEGEVCRMKAECAGSNELSGRLEIIKIVREYNRQDKYIPITSLSRNSNTTSI